MTARVCEICGVEPSSEAEAGQDDKLQRILVEERVLALCPRHAAWLKASNVKTLAEVFELVRATGEKRALIDRRSPLDRRVFPPRPEGRRRSSGRRDDDH